jgi:hypothetical protein
MRKKILLIVPLIILGLLTLVILTFDIEKSVGQTVPPISPWVFITGGHIKTVATSTVTITSLGGSGTRCLQVNNTGLVGLAADACGTGGTGGGLASTSPWTIGRIPYATSTTALTDSIITFSAGNIGISSTTPNALLSIGNSAYINSSGIVVGTWQGTPIADAYVADDITLTNITQITNRALSSLTGTLAIASTTGIVDISDRTNLGTSTAGISLIGDNVGLTAGLVDLQGLSRTKGNLIAGNGTNWLALGVGSNGLCLTASSTASTGLEWRSCAGTTGVSSLNTLTGALTLWGTTNQITVTASSTEGLVFATPQNIHTGASPTFAGLTLSSPLIAGNGGTGFSSYNRGEILFATSTTQLNKLSLGLTGQQLRVATTGVPYWATSTKSIPFTIENPTASENIGIFIFEATSTIYKVYGVHRDNSAANTITFNLVHNPNRQTSTSTVFATNQTITSTTTATVLTSFGVGTTTVAADSILRFTTSAASTTQFTLTIYYKEDW